MCRILPPNSLRHTIENRIAQGLLFSSMRKSPKDKHTKAGKPTVAVSAATDAATALAAAPTSPASPGGHVKPYEYTTGSDADANRRSSSHRPPGGFRYDEDPSAAALRAGDDDAAQLSPNSQARRATGLAFNYAPGADADKLKQQAGQLSPKSQRGGGGGSEIDHLNGEQQSPGRSYSPAAGAGSAAAAGTGSSPGKYRAIGDPTSAFIAGERDNAAAVAAAAAAAAAGKPRYKRIKILVVVSRFDPKTRRCDAPAGEALLVDGQLDTVTGTIATPYGVVDPKTGAVQRTDASTGATSTVQAAVDTKTGNVHVPGVDGVGGGAAVGHLLCFGDADKTAVAVTAITGRIDAATGRVDTLNGTVEHSTGWLHHADGAVDTKYGQIDPRTGSTRALDAKTGRPTGALRAATVDAQTGCITIVGVADARTGKQDNQLGQLISIGQPLDGAVEVVSVVGKPDKRGVLQPATVSVRRTVGLAQTLPNGQRLVDSKFGQINLVKHTVTAVDPRTGKPDVREFKVDAATGQLILRGALNEKTGKFDKDLVQIVSVGAVRAEQAVAADGAAEPQVADGDASVVVVDPKTNQVWVPSSTAAPSAGDQLIYSTSLVDPKSGHITNVHGYRNPKTGELERHQRVDAHVTHVDPVSGQVLTATGQVDAEDEQPLFAVSTADAATGALITRLAKRDPRTGQLTIVRVTPIFAPVVQPQSVQPPATPTGSVSSSPAKSGKKATAVTPPTKPTVAAAIAKTPTTSAAESATKRPVAGASDAFIPVAAPSDDHTAVENPVLEVLTIIGTLDPKTNRIDARTAHVERTRGLLNTRTGFVSTKYGQLHPVSGECRLIDPHTGAVSAVKKAHVDPFTGQITIKGVADPQTGRLDQQLTQQVTLGTALEQPIVEVTSLAGRFDARRGIIEPKTAQLERTVGELNRETGVLRTAYGDIDLARRVLSVRNARTGQSEQRELRIDNGTGQLLLRADVVNPKTGKVDKDFGRLVSVRVVERQVDAATGAEAGAHTDGAAVIVDPKTNRMWTPAGVEPATGRQLYTAAQVDPATGYIITIYGILNTKTNEIEPQTGLDGASGSVRIDPISGQVFTATGDSDEATGEPLFAVSQVDAETGEVYTKVGRIDGRTGKLVLVRILLVTRHDRATGRPQVLDPAACDVDPVTGRVRNIFNKTVYVYNMVDPVTGEIVQVDPSDPRMAGARTTVTQTMTLSGEIDEVTGRIKTEYGHIDPETGDIDPATAVLDPVTGKLILNYAQIDPSHFGKEETVPISRDQFFDGIKHLGKGALRRDSEASSEEDVQAYEAGGAGAAGGGRAVADGRYAGAPTVVWSTTKQVLTKNEDGVTHNVEEEIRNLGTGEVVFSTQEHKVCWPELGDCGRRERRTVGIVV